MSEPTPTEAKALEERLRLAIRTYDFKPQEIHILHFLVDRTHARSVWRALIPSLDYVVRITRILKGDVGAVLRRLENEYGIIVTGPAPEFVSRDRQDPFWFEFITTTTDWRKVGPRADREYVAQLHRELDFIERGQARLATPDGQELTPASLPGLKAEIAAVSHEDALQDERQRAAGIDAGTAPLQRGPQIRSGPSPINRQEAAAGDADDHDTRVEDQPVCGVGKFRTRAENPNTSSPTCEEIPHTPEQFTDAGTRARARHVHEHVPTSVPQSMLHGHGTCEEIPHTSAAGTGAGTAPLQKHGEEHGLHARGLAGGLNAELNLLSTDELCERLDEEARYALDVLEEIVGEGASSFRRTWLLRLCDRWKHHALKAIGEVKRRKVAGEQPRIGWGETANDLFHRAKKGYRVESNKQ